MTVATHVTCGELTGERAGEQVDIRGWVHSTRDHGGLIFVDLRDRFGLTQVVFDPRAAADAARAAGTLRAEDVVCVSGAVRRRPAGTENAKLATGEIEIAATKLEILNRSLTPPFPIGGDEEIDDNLRLRYRYLDLRRPGMQRAIALRHRAIKAVRDHLDRRGFLEIETPMLIKQTPEGARDFIVPSRLHPGEFYALPQSPQLYKQILMVAGFARYFQIARCFRDEDSRADRQPEFTQIDIEMSFPTQDDVIDVVEGMMREMFARTLDVDVPAPFRRLSYEEAMATYGSDKPDLRFGMELRDASAAFAGTEFKVFASALAAAHAIVALVDEGGASRARREFDALVEAATGFGARGLAWVALCEDGVKSSLPKVALSDEMLGRLRAATGAKAGDAVLLVADERAAALAVAGKLRLHLGEAKGLRDPQRFAFCWVLDFPLFERDAQTGALASMHHPFTAPAAGHEQLAGDPLALKAQHYDLVLNGAELGSGSIRIHDPALQRRVFELLGYPEAEAKARFGFLLEAFEYGAPPHGGIALGVDRIMALMVGAPSIRDVIAFPKNQRFVDLMVGAPGPVPDALLREVHVRSTAPPRPVAAERA